MITRIRKKLTLLPADVFAPCHLINGIFNAVVKIAEINFRLATELVVEGEPSSCRLNKTVAQSTGDGGAAGAKIRSSSTRTIVQ